MSKPAEPHRYVWPPTTSRRLASILMLCYNQLDQTRSCAESIIRHTRAPYELILVDNGSADATSDYLASISAHPGPAGVEVIRNPTNRGFSAAANQALAAARGAYLVLLNNDTIVTPGWLEGLIAPALLDYPAVGLIGPVSNYAPPPQLVEAGYIDLAGLDAFAQKRQREYGGYTEEVRRLTGFCLLIRREVYERIGGLDERFGTGFFEDDDYCLRARNAGFRLLLAPGVFIHHTGSQTFRALGLDTHALLKENFGRFREKWGEDATHKRLSCFAVLPRRG